LVFTGRFAHPQKGVLELPMIDDRLRAAGVARSWTVIGAGPDEARLRAAWNNAPNVRFTGALSNAETIDALADHDVFVLPTRSEGLPVALLEAMGAGVVPVVSNIDSGVPDVVAAEVTGVLPSVGDIDGFAAAIEGLASNRARLDRMSAAARRFVEERFDIRSRAADYDALYSRYRELYRPLRSDARLQYGSRLDRPWMPNSIVRVIRTAIRASRATPHTSSGGEAVLT
jgi:glycosyltransferase involved in cell wall biosynthesis